MKDFEKLEPGKIYLFGNWQFPMIREQPVDLFWNAASFAEMEPHVVENYLLDVNSSAKAVFLMQRMKGKKKAKRAGRQGVLEQTRFEDYQRGLSSFELVDRSDTRMPDATVMKKYEDSFWTRI